MTKTLSVVCTPVAPVQLTPAEDEAVTVVVTIVQYPPTKLVNTAPPPTESLVVLAVPVTNNEFDVVAFPVIVMLSPIASPKVTKPLSVTPPSTLTVEEELKGPEL